MIHLHSMTAEDIPSGMVLKTEAGWNQTQDDWVRFLQIEPDGCFVAELDGRAVGTTTTCIFDTVAWIAMVLVAREVRHQGIGTRLVQHALEFLDRQGVPTVRLDATALGRPVYQRLGFVAQYELMRMEGLATTGAVGSPGCHNAGQEQLDALLALDRRATGTSRAKLLARLVAENPHRSWLWGNGEPGGYLISRPGTGAAQIGPVVAGPAAAGRQLLDQALADWPGQRVYVDIPVDNAAALKWAEDRGLRCQRTFTRMCRGRPADDDLRLLWASSGPEKG